MSAIEILGFVTGVVCVFLLVRENIWNWPIGIANNAFYIAVFMKSGLYADAGLQVFYIAISLYGWYQWLHGGRGALLYFVFLCLCIAGLKTWRHSWVRSAAAQ